MSEDSPDGLRIRAFRGVKNYREEVAAIIPMSEDFIMLDFEYNVVHNHELQESMIFKKGQLHKEIKFPAEIEDVIKGLPREKYDVYAARSHITDKTFYLVLKWYLPIFKKYVIN